MTPKHWSWTILRGLCLAYAAKRVPVEVEAHPFVVGLLAPDDVLAFGAGVLHHIEPRWFAFITA